MKRMENKKVPQNARETLFFDGNSYFDALIQDISESKESISLEVYGFYNDPVGRRVAFALADAAKRGVSVRVMVDGAGSPLWSGTFASLLERAGASTKVFHPFPWQLWNWSRSVVKVPLLLKGIYFFLKSNSRNHRKVCVIDRRIAYVGSFNINQRHLKKEDKGDGWRDTAVRLTGVDLNELINAFDAAWEHRTIQERLRDAFHHVRRYAPIRLNYTRHRRRILYKHLLRKIATSQKRIWITNAYFVPDNFLLKHLKDAAHRGVDVRILLPGKSDVMVMPWASSTFYYNLLQSGVRIFEYLPSMLHAKSLIIDDWMLIGSSNLNHRSLLHDLEADVNIVTPMGKQLLEQHFLEDLNHSQEVSLESWYKMRPWYQRFMGRLLLYLKYWI